MCKNLSLEEPAGILVKTTCVDFPGYTASSFFLKGCNLRCPYCYNKELVTSSQNEKLNTIQELFNHLEKRKGIISGVVISGGEPLINPYTPLIIKKAKELGYKIKLDTNGIYSEKLKEILEDEILQPDFIAVDMKTSPSKYAHLLCGENSIYFGNEHFFEENLLKTCKILEKIPSEKKEFRTVLVPTLIKKEDIENIAHFIPKDSTWQFAQFKNQNCLNPFYNEIIPYTDSEIEELISFARKFIPNSFLR